MAEGRKRANGNGSVYQDGTKWVAALTIGKKENGNPDVRRRIEHSKRKARETLRVMLQERDAGHFIADGRTTLGAFLTGYQQRWSGRESSRANMDVRFRRIAASIGNVPLAALTPAHIRKLQRDLLLTHAPRSVAAIQGNLKVALMDAVESGALAVNPCTAAKPPKWEKPEMRVWTIEQIAAFLQATRNDRLYALFVVLAFTGIRRGEACALRWEDIDFAAGVIRIRRTLSHAKGGAPLFGPPKTKASTRDVLMRSTVLQVLKAYQQAQRLERVAAAEWEYPELVFTTPAGKPIGKQLDRVFHASRQRAELPHIRPHDLRHSCATILLSKRHPLQAVQRQLGHSKASTTLTEYGHVLTSMLDDAADEMETLLGTS